MQSPELGPQEPPRRRARPLRRPKTRAASAAAVRAYDETGNPIVIVSLTNGTIPTDFVTVDAADFDRLNAQGQAAPWWKAVRGSTRYVQTMTQDGYGTAVVARLIIQAEPGERVRYRNGNAFDLRRSNLTTNWKKEN